MKYVRTVDVKFGRQFLDVALSEVDLGQTLFPRPQHLRVETGGGDTSYHSNTAQDRTARKQKEKENTR